MKYAIQYQRQGETFTYTSCVNFVSRTKAIRFFIANVFYDKIVCVFKIKEYEQRNLS